MNLLAVALALAPGVTVVEGPVNGVLLRAGGKTLAIYGDARAKPVRADKVLFTDSRRDVVWAGRRLVEAGAEALAPAAEMPYFTGAREFWERYRTGRFHDYAMQSSRVTAEPFAKATPAPGRIAWQGTEITVLDTPGVTRGSVSYLFEAGGKRIACTGSLIYGDGQLFDLFSLQDAIPEAKEDAYHGWAARAADVLASLRQVAAWKPDVLVPARGPVIRDPQAAIERLTGRLRAVFASHFEIDALRWYRGDERIRIQARRVLGPVDVNWMPMSQTQKLPEWIVPISNARLILSASGSAFLVDCGSQRIIEEIRKLRQAGRFSRLDGIFVTHYHDDHTDQVQAAAEEFACPVYAAAEMRDILERSAAYRMPAQTANSIRNVKATADGARQRWNEFEFTWRYLPGQTLYHGALLAKKDGGESVFFGGDSFTPTGIDDYCLLNRNFVAAGRGYLYSLGIIPDALLVNQHVEPAFRFTAAEIARMRENLVRRERLFRELMPWDSPDYGLDEQWARFYPYSGDGSDLKLALLNHSPAERKFRVKLHLPTGWRGPRNSITVAVPAGEERMIPVAVTPAGDGLGIVTADVAFGSWDLREWCEAMVSR